MARSDGAPPEFHAPPPAEAVEAWARACGGPRRLAVESVAVEVALGRVTAEAVWARRSSPAYPAAAMDGIAVASADPRDAREDAPVRLRPGTYDVVDTGDALPAGPPRGRGAPRARRRDHPHR